MKVAIEDLKMANGVVAHYRGDTISDAVLAGPQAREYGWADLVRGEDSKAAQEAQEPSAQPPTAKGKTTSTSA